MLVKIREYGHRGFQYLKKKLRFHGEVGHSLSWKPAAFIIVSVCLPLSLMGFLSLRQIKSIVIQERFESMESIRNQVLADLQSLLEESAERVYRDLFLSGILLTSSEWTDYLVGREKGILSAYTFNFQYAPFRGANPEGLPGVIREDLQERVFAENIEFREIGNDDGTSTLWAFALFRNSETRYYAVWSYDYEYINAFLTDRLEHYGQWSLLNSRYQILGDSRKTPQWSTRLNEQTQRMLDGFFETKIYDDQIHSYAALDLGGEFLYLDIQIPTNVVTAASRNLRANLVFFVILFFMLSGILSWTVKRSLIRWGEGLIIRRAFSKEMIFFPRMEGNIRNLQEKIKFIKAMDQQLDYVLNDLEELKRNIPPEDA